MDNNVQYWLTTKDALAALKEKGLPSTWAQIKLYRDVKLIPPIKNIVRFHRGDSPTKKGARLGIVISKKDMPIFTQQDIEDLVAAVAKIKADEEATRLAKQEEET